MLTVLGQRSISVPQENVRIRGLEMCRKIWRTYMGGP